MAEPFAIAHHQYAQFIMRLWRPFSLREIYSTGISNDKVNVGNSAIHLTGAKGKGEVLQYTVDHSSGHHKYQSPLWD